MKLITCERCGKQEMRHSAARYCFDCKRIINRERTKQSYERKKSEQAKRIISSGAEE